MGRPGYVLGNAKTSVSCDQELYEGFADSNTVYNEEWRQTNNDCYISAAITIKP